MNKKIDQTRRIVFGIIIAECVILFFSSIILKQSITISGILFVISSAGFLYLYNTYIEDNKRRSISTSEMVSNEVSDAFLFGNIGLLTYDDNYVITWMSELFEERKLNHISKKVLVWLPEVNDLFQGNSEKVEVEINEQVYQITRKEDAQVLYFKDITELKRIEKLYNDEQLVVGMIHLDNYEESTQYSEDQEVSAINNNVRQPIVEYCKNFGMLLKRVKSDRFFAVMTEKSFHDLAADRFSILKQTRTKSAELDVAITLSMAFARGSNDIQELDEMANSLLALAQSRGGDQVVIRKKDEDVKFYGGSSEAQEKRSRVRVRIMANAIKNLINKASNVVICGHKEMDFDCIGSALCVSEIAQIYGKQVCIIAKTGGMEEKMNDAYNLYKAELTQRHLFVTESEAQNQLRDDTLLIMVDHHKPQTSNGSNLFDKAKKIMIIDHHRRSADISISPVLVYVEAGASSTSEMVTELVPYLSSDIEINDIEANFMLAGMTVDTNRFRVRTGSRTFDAASTLRKWGADPILVDEFLKDNYIDFETKTNVLKYSERYSEGITITSVDTKLTRSMMSQVADMLLSVKGVEAAFVLAKIGDDEVAISARSSGKINVQVIMEKMHGGGHMTAAAMQREKTKVNNLKEELLIAIDEYLKEELDHESNLTK